MRNNRGFTLIEIIVTLAIVAALAGVGVVAYNGYIDRSQAQACLANRTELARDYDDYCVLFGSNETLAQYVSAQAGGLGGVCPAGGTCVCGRKDGKAHIFCSLHEEASGSEGEDVSIVTPKPAISPSYTPKSAVEPGAPVKPTEAPEPSEPVTPVVPEPTKFHLSDKDADLDAVAATAKSVYEAFAEYIKYRSSPLPDLHTGNWANNVPPGKGSQGKLKRVYIDQNDQLFKDFIAWVKDSGGTVEGFQPISNGLDQYLYPECRIYFQEIEVSKKETKFVLDYVYTRSGLIDILSLRTRVNWAKYGGEGRAKQAIDTWAWGINHEPSVQP